MVLMAWCLYVVTVSESLLSYIKMDCGWTVTIKLEDADPSLIVI